MPTATWDPVWETIFASRPWGRYPPESIVREISRAFASSERRQDIKVLELGCGPGANVWFLAREGYDASGIDGSPTAIDIARARLASEQLTAELVVGDFTSALPWPAASFDAVVDCAALYSNPLAGIRAAITEVQRVLKPGGRFISLSFSDGTTGYGSGTPGDDADAFRNVSEGPLSGTGYVQFFSRPTLNEVFASFATVHVERSSYTINNERQLIELWVVNASVKQ